MSGRYSCCIATVIIWLVGAGICAEEAAPKWGEITEEEKALTPPAEYPEAPAVVVFDIAQMEVKKKEVENEMDRHIRIKVFNKDASVNAAEVEIPFYKGVKITNLEAQTIAPGGAVTVVKDIFTKEMGTVQVLTFAFPAVEDGAFLEYRYHRSCEYIPAPWYFQNSLYTMKSQFSIVQPIGLKRVNQYNFQVSPRMLSVNPRNIQIEPRVTQCKLGRAEADNYTYEATNLFPAKDEPFMRAEEDCLASLVFTFWMHNWKRSGESWDGWYEEFSWNKKRIKAVADSQCAGLSTNEEKIKRLFTFVHDSVTTRAGEDKDENADAILKHRRGGAKYKNMLLTALLRSQEIPAYILLIGRRDTHGDFNPDIFSSSQLDYWVCLAGPESTQIPLDASAEFVTYPRVPSYCLVNHGLLVDGRRSRTITLDEPDWKNGADVVSTIWTQPGGSAICSTSIRVYGCMSERYREFAADTVSAEDITKRFLEDVSAAYTVVRAGRTFDRETGEFSFDIVLNLPAFGSVIDSTMFVAPFIFPIEQNQFSSDRRVFPVDFLYPYAVRHRVRVYLPDNMAVADLPIDVRKNIPGAVFSRKVLTEGNVLDARADLKIDKACFTVTEYPALKALFETMAASGADKIAATVKTPTE